jgi:hypothetical protein
MRILDFYNKGATPIEDDDERDAVVDPLREQQRPIENRICDLPAKTIEGIQAKARNIALWAPDLLTETNGYTDKKFVASILRDLTAGSAVV